MDNPMELINTIMKNPAALEGIKNLMNSTTQETEPDYEEQNLTHTDNASVPDMSFITQFLASNPQSINVMNKMKNAYDAYSDRKDPNINLLDALTPFLSESRTANLDKIKNIVRMGKAASVFTKRQGG